MDLEQVRRFVRAAGPTHDAVQREMAARAEEEAFPIIGPDAGGVLRSLARLTDAERVFEFGSGFGYSASWFLRGGAAHVVLTEHDADELALAEELLARADYAGDAAFEAGDALEAVTAYDGPFDVALIDSHKSQYPAAFDRVRGKVRPGGAVVADNILRGPADFEAVLAHVESGASLDGESDSTVGVATYLSRVRDNDRWESSVLPVGSGLSVSTKVR